MTASFEGWTGARVLAEWGYERNPDFHLSVPWHEHMGVEHTRRGAWRGVFQAAGIIHGFENSWGPWCVLDTDQAGMADLLQVRRFLTEVVDFTILRPAAGLLAAEQHPDPGRRARVLASADREVVAVYLPVGGDLTVPPVLTEHRLRWFDPRTGELTEVPPGATLVRPPDGGADRDDWIAVFTRTTG
jgi:hypothetical protein